MEFLCYHCSYEISLIVCLVIKKQRVSSLDIENKYMSSFHVIIVAIIATAQ